MFVLTKNVLTVRTVFDYFAFKTSNIMDGEGHFGKSENAIMILSGDGEL